MQKRCYVCEKVVKNSKALFRINDNPEFNKALGKNIDDLNNQVICMKCKIDLLTQISIQKIEEHLLSTKKTESFKPNKDIVPPKFTMVSEGYNPNFKR